jgi:hypothetical protein
VLKSKNLNPYEGIDVKDKVMVVLGAPFPGFPRGVTRADLSGTQGLIGAARRFTRSNTGEGNSGDSRFTDSAKLGPASRACFAAAALDRREIRTQPNTPSVPSATMSMKMATHCSKARSSTLRHW